MDYINFNLTDWVQRTIELLSFYLILSNVNGQSLKESLTRLVVTKQKVLYGNMVLLIVYPVAITLVIYVIPRQGHLIDLLLYPLVVCFLLRRVFSLKKPLLSYILLMIVSSIGGIFTVAFSLNTIVGFLMTLFITIALVAQGCFEQVYTYLSKRDWLFNAVTTLSLVFYVLPFLLESFSTALIASLLFLFSVIALYLNYKSKREMLALIDQLKNATSDEFIPLLKELSLEHTQSSIIHQYTIQNPNIKEIFPCISRELGNHRALGTLSDYECIVTKRQIKINVII